jgi:hypothetical protein
MIYRDYAREYEKYSQLKKEHEEKKRKEEKPAVMVRCPYCNKLISEKIKVCMYCHGKILTPLEMLVRKVFRTRNIIIMISVFVITLIGALLLINPKLLSFLK